MDALHAGQPHQGGPALAAGWFGLAEAEIGREVQERLFHEPGHHAGIGPAAIDRGRAAWIAAAGVEQRLAERVVGALLRPGRLVEVETRPGLHHRVDVKGADLAAEFEDGERGGVDREVDAESLAAAVRQQRHQDVAVVFPGEALLQERDPALVEQRPVRIDRIDHCEPRAVVLEMPLDEGQRAAADRAETDHHDRTADAAVDGPSGHPGRTPEGLDGDACRPCATGV
jgi:hypothetical protein